MAFTIQDSTCRAALHAEGIAAGWVSGETSIFDTAPFLAKGKADLPLMFVRLLTLSPQGGSGAAAMREVEVIHPYEVTGLFLLPQGVNIEAYKVSKCQALLNAMPPLFAGWIREFGDIDFSEDSVSEGDPILTITVPVNFHVITDF